MGGAARAVRAAAGALRRLCRLPARGLRQHPDLTRCARSRTRSQIRIEQVRELCAELALTSHAGGYKVGDYQPGGRAEPLRRQRAAEDSGGTPGAHTADAGGDAALATAPDDPEPLPAPAGARARRGRGAAWLSAARGARPWEAALDALGEAPFLPCDADPEEVAAVGAESAAYAGRPAGGAQTPSATAERWARAELPLRLQCFENWLTERIRRGARAGAFMTEMRAGPYLSGGAPVLNIRELFGSLTRCGNSVPRSTSH